jgi:hypothetical protein
MLLSAVSQAKLLIHVKIDPSHGLCKLCIVLSYPIGTKNLLITTVRSGMRAWKLSAMECEHNSARFDLFVARLQHAGRSEIVQAPAVAETPSISWRGRSIVYFCVHFYFSQLE